MKPILALEAAALTASVAVVCRNGEVIEWHTPDNQLASEHLIPLATRLLATTGYRFAELDAIAFGSGPGAFTGLRLACATALGFAEAWSLPVLSVPTLAAMAWSARQQYGSDEFDESQPSATPRSYQAGSTHGVDLDLLCCIDAHLGEVYWRRFSPGELTAPSASAAELARPRECLENWARLPLPDLVLGNALLAYPELAAFWRERQSRLAANYRPSAAGVAALAATGYAVDGREPIYIRNQVALTIRERLALGGKA